MVNSAIPFKILDWVEWKNYVAFNIFYMFSVSKVPFNLARAIPFEIIRGAEWKPKNMWEGVMKFSIPTRLIIRNGKALKYIDQETRTHMDVRSGRCIFELVQLFSYFMQNFLIMIPF